MSDSSSVDRWHPSNVEWPTKDRKIKPGPKQVVLQVSGGGFDSYSGFQFAMMFMNGWLTKRGRQHELL